MRKALRATAIHEAAHAVAYLLKGCPVDAVHIQRTASDAGQCVTSLSQVLSIPEADRGVAILAGITAQRRFCARGVRRPHWESDYSTLAEIALGIAEGDELAAERWIDGRQREADEFVEKYWGAIQKVADALICRRTLTGEEVVAIIG